MQTRKDFPGRGRTWRPDTTWEVWGKPKAAGRLLWCVGVERLGSCAEKVGRGHIVRGLRSLNGRRISPCR